MSKRGTDFLELWMLANVKAGGNAANLAVRCAADALMGGLSLEEIEEEAGPLKAFIAATLAHPADGTDAITETDD
jgi:hypothetical protein